ncbi:MAG TPA: alpha/beta hydrolase, partial [Gaiellaceae bacterium]
MKRWLRRIGIAIAALVVGLTIASLAYNAVTRGRDVAATKLYAGPYVRADGTQLAYRRWGSHGSPIVLLGGFIEPSWVWHEAGPILGRTHRVYALDLPPFGYSQRRGPFTLAHWTELVRAFDTRLSIRRPLLVGHSLGAAVAVSVATQAPGSVSGIVLLDGDALPGGGAGGWLTDLLVPPWFTTLYRIATGWDWIFRRGLQSA